MTSIRVGRLEVTFRVRRKRPCQACSGLGWFYMLGTLSPMPPPAGCTGVALCGCGTAVDRINDTQRAEAAHRRSEEAPF